MREKDKRDQGNRKRVVDIKNSTVWWFLQISHKRVERKQQITNMEMSYEMLTSDMTRPL